MRPHRRRRAPTGFTLIEVVIALALSGAVLLGARMLLNGLADAERRIAASAAAIDAEANGDRLLRTLLGRLEVGRSPSERFSGGPERARFTTWCEMPAGWLERCEVELAIETTGAGSTLTARFDRFDDGSAITLRRGLRSGGLRYLNSAANGGEWFHTWGTGVTAPLALGVILDRDTLIVRIGERG